MKDQLLQFSDLLKYARELKNAGIDKYHRYCILKGFAVASKLANKRHEYELDYAKGEQDRLSTIYWNSSIEAGERV